MLQRILRAMNEINTIIKSYKEILRKLNQPLTGHSAFMGFDACIDFIVRIVRDKNPDDTAEYFSDSSQFGEFLLSLENKSCGLELQTKLSKIGGNMVITSNALGNLGIKIECVGTFGLPDILPVFHSMSDNCTLHTIEDTISATALEFNNSKVIMFDPGPYNHLSWSSLKKITGIDRLKELISEKELVGFVNWSEIENSSQIWEGFLDEVLPEIHQTGHKPYFFTDFSDCSRKSKKDILHAFELLNRFRKYFRVYFSLNQNEAGLIAKTLGIDIKLEEEKLISEFFNKCNSDTVIIHRTQDAIAYDGEQYFQFDTFFCSEPKILTGGGDNFNAGFCFALLHGFNLFDSLILANSVAGLYVKNGVSPNLEDLKEFLEKLSRDSM